MRIKEINRCKTMRLLEGQFPKEILDEMYAPCQKELLAVIKPRYVYKIYEKGDGLLSLIAPTISGLVKSSDKIILLAATLSVEAEMLIASAQMQNPAKGAILNTMAGIALTEVCNKILEEISDEYYNYNFTRCYSPSIGDIPKFLEEDLLLMLDAKNKIGLYLNDKGLLMPKKSVTAVAGMLNRNKPYN